MAKKKTKKAAAKKKAPVKGAAKKAVKKKAATKKKAPTKKSPKKKAVAKKAAVKRKVAKKKVAKKAASKKKVAGKKAAKKKVVKKVKRKKRKAGLGRPKVTGEEKLFLLFKDNYEAREVFDFLRVHRVKELEEFSPQEIFDRLTATIRVTVESIRITLARNHRHLADDADFALEYKARYMSRK